MRLIVNTDCKETTWLEYILQEFQRIQDADFDIEVRRSANDSSGESCVLNYSLRPLGEWIPRITQTFDKTDVDWLSDELYILSGAKSDESGLLAFDIFANMFWFLSRKEEWLAEKNGHHINSYSSRHPRPDKATFLKPVVNTLFDQLEKCLIKNFPLLKFGKGKTSDIELSHDLDYVRKTLPLRLKQSAFNTYNTFRSLGKPKEMKRHLGRLFSFAFSNADYWKFDYWHELERRFNKRSTFYVYSKINRSTKTWLLDPSYDVANNPKLIKSLRELIERGHEIGLHGSFFSAMDGGLLLKEREQLSQTIGYEIKKIRQHWLRYRECHTPLLHEKYFQIDSTVGWNDQMGFRAGVCSMYRPFNHDENRVFDYFIVPQILMDSQLYDYASGHFEETFVFAKQTIDIARSHKNAHFAISWHPRTASRDYGWHESYEALLAHIFN